MKQYLNIIMVCGSGKNVGKTTLSALLVKYFYAQKKEVYAIKTSSHLHALDDDEEIIYHDTDCDIVKETRDNNKDSSLLLQAGAMQSFYIQANSHKLFLAFQQVMLQIPKHAVVVCESGGLREFIQPELFLFVDGERKSKNLKYKPNADKVLHFGVDFNQDQLLTIEPLLQQFI